MEQVTQHFPPTLLFIIKPERVSDGEEGVEAQLQPPQLFASRAGQGRVRPEINVKSSTERDARAVFSR